MYLQGQATRSTAAVGGRRLPCAAFAEAGFALAALLVAIAILSVMMLVALPTWRHQAQREKENELIFRGEQYARAIGLYQRKLAGAFPPSLDILVEQKFLRKKYKDPITGEDFLPVYAASEAGAQALRQGAEAQGATTAIEATRGPDGPRGLGATTSFQSPRGATEAPRPPSSALAGPAGGIVGVVSKSKAQSIRLYNGRDRHDQWVFTYASVSARPGQTTGPGQPPATQAAPGLPMRGRGSGSGPGRGGQ